MRRRLEGPVEEVAPLLLGLRLRTELPPGPTEVLITEVEAYGGERDPASHAYRGRTARNASMFGPPATLYVYRSYGVHWCMNIVIGAHDDASAVLIRAGRPLVGADVMAKRRGRSDHLVDGPGKLTQALAVSGAHDGTAVFGGSVQLLDAPDPPGRIIATPRVGITKAVAWPWRFVLVES
ncbi:MAG: DNA-3-methyladenine glycosylase [Acidimicrobiia bacterium]|nr:DNA-3-methyladenine glycosylase [Acidimicrobiia bacterium]